MQNRAHVDPASLRREAEYLARSVFGLGLNSADAERYANADSALAIASHDPDGSQRALLTRAIDDRLDLEAIELVLRLSNRRNVVTMKVHVLAFLLESDPRHVRRFLADRPQRVRALLSIAGHAARAPWKYLRGSMLLRRLRRTDA
jgi:hypothetical protein